jgi:hypothetical protein
MSMRREELIIGKLRGGYSWFGMSRMGGVWGGVRVDRCGPGSVPLIKSFVALALSLAPGPGRRCLDDALSC